MRGRQLGRASLGAGVHMPSIRRRADVSKLHLGLTATTAGEEWPAREFRNKYPSTTSTSFGSMFVGDMDPGGPGCELEEPLSSLG